MAAVPAMTAVLLALVGLLGSQCVHAGLRRWRHVAELVVERAVPERAGDDEVKAGKHQWRQQCDREGTAR